MRGRWRLPYFGFVVTKINSPFEIRSIFNDQLARTAILFMVRHFDNYGSDDRQGLITLPG
jgi:hypothetical protein